MGRPRRSREKRHVLHGVFASAILAGMLGAGCNSVFGIHEGSPRPLCVDPLLIDDLEDGDAILCASGGRHGAWYDLGDLTAGARLTPPQNGPFKPTPIEGQRENSRYAAHFGGSGFNTWGALMGFNLNDQGFGTQPYAASNLGGIRFWMKSNQPVTVQFRTPDTIAPKDGGQCVDGNCNNDFSFPLTAPSDDWAAYDVPFSALRQLAPGGSATWNPRFLIGIQFNVGPGVAFDVWVDDLRFYYCSTSACLPTCRDLAFPVSCPASDRHPASCLPPGTDCAAMDTWCADPLLIDDMEDGDDRICDSAGRHGGWSSQSDGGSGKLAPAPGAIFTQTLIPEGRGASHHAARLTGSGLTGFALMGFSLNYQGTREAEYDGSKFDGITFSMKSDVPVTLGFTSPETLPVSDGGTCDLTAGQENCRHHFEFAMRSTGNEWLDYKVPFAALRQAANRATPFSGGTASATWNASRLRAMAFLTSSPDFDVWIDDIRFYTCAADACLPTCTGDTPVACAASGSRPAGCWPVGTDCSSPPDFVNTAIWGAGPDDVWMVGQSAVAWAGALFHWDGVAWTPTPSGPLPPIWGLWGNGTNDVWAVADHGIILHQTDSLSVASGDDTGTTSALVDIWGSGPSDIWVVGETGTMVHWNGAAWTAVATGSKSPGLAGIWGSGASDLWAVGLQGTILHWDGLAWSVSPSGVSTDLMDVWGTSHRDAWAVGRGGAILHWNGDAWSPSPSETTIDLMGVWGSGPGDVWAVGKNGIVRHWDGLAWHALTSGTRQVLNKVWGSGPNDVWAIGSSVIHWNGTAWSMVGP